jgi:hypothetical protein
VLHKYIPSFSFVDVESEGDQTLIPAQNFLSFNCVFIIRRKFLI